MRDYPQEGQSKCEKAGSGSLPPHESYRSKPWPTPVGIGRESITVRADHLAAVSRRQLLINALSSRVRSRGAHRQIITGPSVRSRTLTAVNVVLSGMASP